jgi:hypothetical protein
MVRNCRNRMQAKDERKTEKEKAVGSHGESVQVAWIR